MNQGAQLQLPMLTLYKGPKLLEASAISEVRTFRDAVLVCWNHKTRRNLSQRTLCEEVNELLSELRLPGPAMRPSHVTEYLSRDITKREMPARFINAFEISMGNRAITQWHNRCAGMHHLEQLAEMLRLAA